jgi:hypothetical protein
MKAILEIASRFVYLLIQMPRPFTYQVVISEYRGVWSGTMHYYPGDVCSLANVWYICLKNHTNHTPPNSTYWLLWFSFPTSPVFLSPTINNPSGASSLLCKSNLNAAWNSEFYNAGYHAVIKNLKSGILHLHNSTYCLMSYNHGLGVLTTNPAMHGDGVDVNGTILRIRTSRTPSSSSDVGYTGEICWDANYIYVCTATDTWKRSPLTTW